MGLRKFIDFYSTGFDSGFSFSQMKLVWKLAKMAEVDEPTILFWSVPAINRAIALVVQMANNVGSINDPHTAELLNKFYAYRSKIELDPPLKTGLKNTCFIRPGQRFRIVLPSNGIFYSMVLNNDSIITVTYPEPAKPQYRCYDWRSKKITVYFWRKNDAGYIFDTTVHGVGHYHGRPVLFLEQTSNLQRSQKRRSIRCPCSIMADLYLLTDPRTKNIKTIELEPGIKCLIEDLSEDGALIRIGGKGVEGMAVKLQFKLGDKTIVMSGAVRSVEFNQKMNQSRLHFQASGVDELTRQIVSMYVYSVIPEEQKEDFDSISLDEDGEESVLPDDEGTLEEI
ncbi:MAG: PilZ domain-containing protein [Spirochaetaceae bacterium]|nr:PilZ domain-containing protein [Spirochaetaceae bacterium]